MSDFEHNEDESGFEDLSSFIDSSFLDRELNSSHKVGSAGWFDDAADAFRNNITDKLRKAALLADVDTHLVDLLRETYRDMIEIQFIIRKGKYTKINRYKDKSAHFLLGTLQSTRAFFYRLLTSVGATPMSRRNKHLVEPPPATANTHGNKKKGSKVLTILKKDKTG